MAVTISRNQLQQEFLDLTSEKMLVQPESAYIFARLIFLAWQGAELKAQGVQLGVDVPVTDSGAGRAAPNHGAAVPPFQSNQLLELGQGDIPAAEAVMVDLSLAGSGPNVLGHSVRFNRPLFTNSTYTVASRTIASGLALSTTPIAISAEQVNVTVSLVGGPYDNTQSAIAPYAISVMDAMRSVHDLSQLTAENLVRDRYKYLDTVVGTYTTLAATNVFPADPNNSQTTAAGAFNAAGDRPFDVETLYRAEEQLDTNNWPRFADGSYYAVLHPRAVRQLKSDPEWKGQSVFLREFNFLAQAYVGQIGKIKVFESTTVPTGTANSVTYYQNSLFGKQLLGYVPAWMCHARSFNEDNAGLTPKTIWVAGEGHSLLDNRAVIGMWSD